MVKPAGPYLDVVALLADWTAAHELSHLLLPYLGRRHDWFAEGFASYIQYQVMYHMGVLDWRGVVDRYRRQMTKAAGRYDLPALPSADAAPGLRSSGDYPTMYWGGAVLFLRADSRLARRGLRPGDVIAAVDGVTPRLASPLYAGLAPGEATAESEGEANDG